MPLRRESSYANDLAGEDADGFDPDGDLAGRARRAGVRVSFHGWLAPKTRWGRIAAGGGLLLLAGAGIAAALGVRSFLLHDEHFRVESSASIQIAGNSHLTRPQLLSVFGEDVDRNIFNIPLGERRAELESLPWVARATVMRLLPNRVRVAIVERTPVAFVRQGAEIGLVDANGVLLDLAGPDADGAADGDSERGATREIPHYSFPVLTGISAADPLSTRAARMRIYMGFVAALDATGEDISQRLSEVDLSNPEDVKAIIPERAPDGTPDKGADAGHAGDILVHLGDGKYLERYHQYEEHLAEWRAQYPRLASVDMRYERQVVLEMQPGAAVAASGAGKDLTAAAPAKAAAEKAGSIAGKPAVAKEKAQPAKSLGAKSQAGTGGAKAGGVPEAKAAAVPGSGAAAVPHLTTAFAVGPGAAKQMPAAAKPAAIAKPIATAKPAAGQTSTSAPGAAFEGAPR